MSPKGQGVFFVLWPLFARPPRHWFLENFLLSAPGVHGVYFLLCSVGRRDLSAGPEQKKKTPPRVFFCSGPGERQGKEKPRAGTGLLLPLPFPGAGAKKKHPGWCFFLLRPRADAHSLTAGLGGDASPSPGWCFVFAAAPPGPGWCFCFGCGPARTLTHSLWAGAISARPGWCFFFCCGPAGSF